MQIRQVVQGTQLTILGSLIPHVVPVIAWAGWRVDQLCLVLAGHHGVNLVMEDVQVLGSQVCNCTTDGVMQVIHTILC